MSSTPPSEPSPSTEAVSTDAVSGEPEQTESAAPAARKRAPRKPSKPDAVLAAAVDKARDGLLEVAPAEQIGAYVGATPDAERVVTHRFEALRPGYNGWHWYSTVARVPRSKVVTVSEVGLLPSEKSVLAPEWVPWSERVRPEDVAAEEAARALEEGIAADSRGDDSRSGDSTGDAAAQVPAGSTDPARDGEPQEEE